MKEQILTALKQKYANLGLSDQVLNSVSEMLANSVKEDSEIEGAISGVEGILKAFQSDTDKIRTATAKKSQKKEDPEPTPKNNPEPTGGDDVPEWAKALTANISTLSAEVKALKGEKLTAQRKGVFNELIKDLPDSLKKAYSYTNLTDMSDDDFTAFTDDVKKNVEAITKEIGIKGGIFKTPVSGKKENPASKSDSEIKAIVDKIKI